MESAGPFPFPSPRGAAATFFALSAMALFAHPFAKADPRAEVEGVSFARGCSDADSSGTLNPAGDFEVRFTNLFATASSPETNVVKACDVTVAVQPPRGFALAINGATLEGAARARNAVGIVRQSYAIESETGSFSQNDDTWNTSSRAADGTSYDSADVKPFEQKFGPAFARPSDIPPDWRGRCGALTHVKGHLELEADSSAGGSVELYADRTRVDGPKNASVKWDWELVPCDDGAPTPLPPAPLLEGAWKFQYLAPNGRTVAGRLTLSGNTGSYRAQGANWTGVLKDLRSEGGSVKGSWQALDQAGWVVFTPDADGRGFHGEWGNTGAGATGFWNGQKE